MKTKKLNSRPAHKGIACLLGSFTVAGILITGSVADHKPNHKAGGGGGGGGPGQFETVRYTVTISDDLGASSVWKVENLIGRIESADGRMLINQISGGGSVNPTVIMQNLLAVADDGAACCGGLTVSGSEWGVCFDAEEKGTIVISGDGVDFQQNLSASTKSGKPESYHLLANTGSGWTADPLDLAVGGTADLVLGCWTMKASKKSRVSGGCTACGDFSLSGHVTIHIERLP